MITSIGQQNNVILGYLKLTDAAPLIIASELGFFREQQLKVALTQDVSWANIRDKLMTGALDGAHMLAPMHAMTTLGISGLRVPMLTGLVLSRNGNAITLSNQVVQDISLPHFATSERQLSASLLKHYLHGDKRKLTLAVVHGFSTHNLILRRWLCEGGIDPDKDVSIIVVPPSQVLDSLKNGLIDGFCAGAPWGSIAVNDGVGITVAAGVDIWRDAPEKVFCVTEKWHQANVEKHLRLRCALMGACEWLANPENRRQCAEILALPQYLDLDIDQLMPSLSGELSLGAAVNPQYIADYQVFKPAAPEPMLFEAMIEECLAMVGVDIGAERISALAQRTARADFFASASLEIGNGEVVTAQ